MPSRFKTASIPVTEKKSRRSACKCDHGVQFYESDAFLVNRVSEFVGTGLRGGENAIVIATKAHRDAIDAGLKQQGIDICTARTECRYYVLDAAETLSKFMVDGAPDETLFNKVVGGLVSQASRNGAKLRAFGEMVALLFADGNETGAIQLEKFWNNLSKTHSFSLLCAYPMKGFSGVDKATAFAHICDEHSTVQPAEIDLTDSESQEYSRRIAILQQQACSLQAEIEERKRAEAELRRSKEELSTFIENATIGLHWVGADGIIQWANRAEMDLLGYSANEYIGHHIAEFHVDRPVIEDILARLTKDEKLKDYPARLKCKDGSIKRVLIDSCVLWENGRFVHTQCFTRDVTREMANNESANRLAAIVESSDDAIVSKDLNGIITSWNNGAQRIFGYSAEETIGKSITMLIPEGRQNEEPEILRRIRAGERVDHFETVRQRKDGKLIDVSITISPVKNSRGEIIGASKIGRDITENKRIQQTLTQRTRMLEVLNHVASKLVAELDPEKIVQAVTDAGREITNAGFGAFFYNVKNETSESYTLYTLSGVPRETFAKFPMPRVTALFSATFRGEGVVRVGDVTKDPRYGKNEPYHGMPAGHLPVRSYLAVPVVSRSGEVLGGLFFGHPQADVFTAEAEGLLVGLAAQAAVAIDNANLYTALQRELTERTRAQESLRQSEMLLRQLADAMPQMVWAAKPDGSIDYFNKRWYDYTGFAEVYDENSWTQILHRDDVKRSVAAYRKSIESEQPFEIEYRFKDRTTGGYRWFLGRALPIRDQVGKVIRCFGTCTDIDDQKRASEKLELAVAQRTASLQEAVAQMEEFSYSVSHDLRGPLRAMQGYCHILLEDAVADLSADNIAYLKRIANSAERLDRLIQDVLAYTRVSRVEMSVGTVALEHLVSDVLRSYIGEFHPTPQITVQKPLLNVVAHEPSLLQCLSNLISNAFKFVAPDTVPQVRVWTQRVPEGVRIWIEDNGIGIQPDQKAKIFNMFERAPEASKYPGTGVGLAIVKKAIHRMHGDVGFESVPGKGSQFWIQLPSPPL